VPRAVTQPDDGDHVNVGDDGIQIPVSIDVAEDNPPTWPRSRAADLYRPGGRLLSLSLSGTRRPQDRTRLPPTTVSIVPTRPPRSAGTRQPTSGWAADESANQVIVSALPRTRSPPRIMPRRTSPCITSKQTAGTRSGPRDERRRTIRFRPPRLPVRRGARSGEASRVRPLIDSIRARVIVRAPVSASPAQVRRLRQP
jgi:hypothetical protein